MCRECTGHLALLEGESPARPKHQTKQDSQQPKPNKQTQGQGLAKSDSSDHARVKGPSKHAKRTRSVALPLQLPFALGTVPGNPGIVTMDALLLKRLGQPTCRFISCTRKIGRHDLQNNCRGGAQLLQTKGGSLFPAVPLADERRPCSWKKKILQ